MKGYDNPIGILEVLNRFAIEQTASAMGVHDWKAWMIADEAAGAARQPWEYPECTLCGAPLAVATGRCEYQECVANCPHPAERVHFGQVYDYCSACGATRRRAQPGQVAEAWHVCSTCALPGGATCS